jgi:hypothetical protein
VRLVDGSAPAPTTVSEVVARMRSIEAGLPASDGVACFTRLYRQVTEEVDQALGATTFDDPAYLTRLDLAFANLFLAALDGAERDPGSAPSAWRPLFEARSRRGIAPIQFAIAGMNAHINRDLPIALVATCEAAGIELRSGSPEHADFLRVNRLLAAVEERLRPSYLSGWAGALDRILHRFHRLDDVVAMWNIGRARDAAWTNGEALWALRGQRQLAADFVASLDRMVGLAGRGLLVPADSFLQRLARRLRRV